MALPRVIPVLLLKDKGLVKTVKFKGQNYIGDPINAVKIFNEKEVDELIFVDIDASKENREPPYDYMKEIATECFMPLAYGGGVKTLDQARRLIQSGIEKIIINHNAIENPDFIKAATDSFGSSTIVGAMDIKKNFFGNYQVYSHVKKTTLALDPVAHARNLAALGIGELFVNNVDLDGVMKSYDLSIIKKITDSVEVPVIACGGAGNMEDLRKVLHEGQASAAAAGSIFIYHGKHKAVLITYPSPSTLHNIFSNQTSG
jgi:cyclase